MNKTIIALVALLASASLVKAAVTIEVQAAELTTSTGSAVANGSYIEILSLGTSGTFTAPTSTSFITGTEFLVGGFALNGNITSVPTAGGFDQVLTNQILTSPNFVTGDQLAIVWFPTITAAGAGPGAGTSYGEYTSTNLLVPSDSNTVLLKMFTANFSGASGLPNVDGQATLTVAGSVNSVPEPSAYALFGGIAALGLAAFRRRRSLA